MGIEFQFTGRKIINNVEFYVIETTVVNASSQENYTYSDGAVETIDKWSVYEYNPFPGYVTYSRLRIFVQPNTFFCVKQTKRFFMKGDGSVLPYNSNEPLEKSGKCFSSVSALTEYLENDPNRAVQKYFKYVKTHKFSLITIHEIESSISFSWQAQYKNCAAKNNKIYIQDGAVVSLQFFNIGINNVIPITVENGQIKIEKKAAHGAASFGSLELLANEPYINAGIDENKYPFPPEILIFRVVKNDDNDSIKAAAWDAYETIINSKNLYSRYRITIQKFLRVEKYHKRVNHKIEEFEYNVYEKIKFFNFKELEEFLNQ